MYIINTLAIYLTFVITRHLVFLDFFVLYFFYLGGGSCRRYGGMLVDGPNMLGLVIRKPGL